MIALLEDIVTDRVWLAGWLAGWLAHETRWVYTDFQCHWFRCNWMHKVTDNCLKVSTIPKPTSFWPVSIE